MTEDRGRMTGIRDRRSEIRDQKSGRRRTEDTPVKCTTLSLREFHGARRAEGGGHPG